MRLPRTPSRRRRSGRSCKRAPSRSAAGPLVISAAVLLRALPVTAAQLTDTWTGGNGTWSTAAKWSLGVVPNDGANTYLVAIDGNNPVNSTVTQDVSATVDGLTIDSGDSLSVNNAISLRIINGGTLTDNGTLSLNSTGNLVDFHFNGGLSVMGGGSILLSDNSNNRIYSDNGGALTLPTGFTLSGSGQLGVGQTSFTSGATITATGGAGLFILPSAGGFTNTGTLQAMGGPLVLQGANFTNTGGTITAQDGSEVRLNSTTISGGMLNSVGTGFVHDISTVRLDGVTLAGSYRQDNATSTTLLSSITNNGQISLNSTANLTDLAISADATIGGTGSILLSGNPNNRIYANGNQHLTFGSGQTIRGSGQIGVGQTTVTNNGQIIADGAGGMVLAPGAGGFANVGGIQAVNGAPLTLQNGQFANTGTIQVMDTSQLRLSAATVTGGTITASGTATFHAVGGTSTLNGLSASGPMSVDAGSLLVNNVNYTGTVTVNNATLFELSGPFTQAGDLTLNSTGNLADLAIVGSQTYGGTGTITLSNNANNRIYSTNGGTLTLPATRTIHGAGQLGLGQTGFVSAALIDANQPTGMTIQPNGAGFMNTGTLQASGGGLLVLQGDYTNTGATIQALAGSEVRLSSAMITGGSVTAVGTGFIHDISRATLDNVTLTGTYNQDNATLTTLVTALTNNGTINLNASGNLTDLASSGDVVIGGTGSIHLSDNANNRIYSANSTHLTFNQNVSGSGQIGVGQTSIVNNALIDSNGTQGMTIQPGAGGATNAGTLQASNGGTLLLQNGTFTNTGAGLIQALAGSQLQLRAATIVGGPLTAAPTAAITNLGNATLDSVTLTGTYNQANALTTQLLHTFINNGTIYINSTGNLTDLVTTNAVTIGGTGSFVLSDSPNNRIYSVNNMPLTIGAGQTIRGSGQIGVAQTPMVNNGTIDATGTAGIVVNPGGGGFANSGTLQADSGSFLRLQGGTFTNSPAGVIQALGNSELRLDGATIVNGTLAGAVHTLSTGTLTNSSINGSLVTNAGTTTTFSHNANRLTSTLTSLTLGNNSVVNLTDNNLQINYGGGPSPVAAVRAALTTGYNHGGWNGIGINSSDGSATRALGYADTADGGIAGLPTTANAVLVDFTVVGDLNLDGSVNFNDLLRLAQNYGKTGANWDQGDLNYDGSVGFNDLLALAQNYGTSLASEGGASAELAPVPEPAVLLAAAAPILLLRRRRAPAF